MSKVTSNIDLRQGMVITFVEGENKRNIKEVNEIVSLGRFGIYYKKMFSSNNALLVISQDCDINNQRSHIEFIVLKPLANPDKFSPEDKATVSQAFHALHIQDENGNLWVADHEHLVAIQPVQFNDVLVGNINESTTLTRFSYESLISFLINIRTRIPFPHNFNFLFKKAIEESGVMGKMLYLTETIRNIHIWVNEEEELAEKYHFQMTAVCYYGKDISEVLSIMSELEKYIETHFSGQLIILNGIDEEIEGVERNHALLVPELAVNDEDFNFATNSVMKQYYLDYICNTASFQKSNKA